MNYHSFEIDIANVYGVDGAIMLFNFDFWIDKNKKNRKNFHNGRYWTYNSLTAFCEQFPYWSKRQIERTLNKLIESGVLLKDNFNENKYDRTCWYSIDEKVLSISRNGDMDITKNENQKHQTVNSYTDNKPNKNQYEESKDSLVGGSEDLFGNPKQPKKEKEKNSAKKEKAPEFTTFHFRQSLLELGANAEHLDDWLKVRKQKKAVNSRTALNGFILECQKSGTEIKEAVETCAKNSWSGFKSSWMQSDKKEDNKGESTFIF